MSFIEATISCMNSYTAALCGLALLMNSAIASELPPDENRLHAEHLPTPFSAGQLQAFNVPGSATVYRIEIDGRAPVQHSTTWLESETGKGRFVTRELSADGVPVGEAQTAESDWVELQGHASFPAAATTIATESIETEAGAFDCWRYEVTRSIPADGGRPRTLVMTFWFAKDRPGPPVLMTHRVDGELKLTMTLIRDSRPEMQAGS